MAFLFTLYQNIWLFVGIATLLAIWELIWKGIALWFAGKNQQKGWFVVLLLFNTAGILPIIYLLCCRNPSKTKPTKKVYENKGFQAQTTDTTKEVVKVEKKAPAKKKTPSKKSTKT